MNDATPKPTRQLLLQKVYLKDASFETPMGIKAFQQPWKPKLSQEIQTRHAKIENNVYEVVLITTLKGLLGEAGKEETAFIAEVQQAGIFLLITDSAELEKKFINAACPNILFPYVREAIDNLVVKAGFPAINLPPVNFDNLYQQALQQSRTSTSH